MIKQCFFYIYKKVLKKCTKWRSFLVKLQGSKPDKCKRTKGKLLLGTFLKNLSKFEDPNLVFDFLVLLQLQLLVYPEVLNKFPLFLFTPHLIKTLSTAYFYFLKGKFQFTKADI